MPPLHACNVRMTAATLNMTHSLCSRRSCHLVQHCRWLTLQFVTVANLYCWCWPCLVVLFLSFCFCGYCYFYLVDSFPVMIVQYADVLGSPDRLQSQHMLLLAFVCCDLHGCMICQWTSFCVHGIASWHTFMCLIHSFLLLLISWDLFGRHRWSSTCWCFCQPPCLLVLLFGKVLSLARVTILWSFLCQPGMCLLIWQLTWFTIVVPHGAFWKQDSAVAWCWPVLITTKPFLSLLTHECFHWSKVCSVKR